MPRPPKSQANIRQATSSDKAELAAIGVQAFINEPIDDQWFPLKAVFYPKDHHRAYIDEMKLRMMSPGEVIMVAEIDDVGTDGTKDKGSIETKQQTENKTGSEQA